MSNVVWDASNPSEPLGMAATKDAGGLGQPNVVSFTQMYNGSTWDKALRAVIYKPIAASAAGANAVWTPAAGKKFRLMGFHLSFSGTVNAKWQDGTTDITGLYYGVANTVVNGGLPEANGYLSAAADNVLNLNLSAAVAVGGLVWGVEE